MLDIRSWGCGTHLLVIGAMVLVGLSIAVGRNWETVALMADNVTVMGEGAAEAEQLRYPRDLVDYLAAHPERASLVAYDMGAPEQGVWYRAERERPVVQLAQLRLLAAYARAVAAGRMDSTHRVSLDSVAVYAVPGAARQAYTTTRGRWAERGVLRADSTVPIRAVARAAFRHDDPAAADALLAAVGRSAVDTLGWGAPGAMPLPQPRSGRQLAWMLSDGADPTRDQVYRLFERVRGDSAFRQRHYARIATRGSGLTLRQQRQQGAQDLPRASAGGYARLLGALATGRGGPSAATTHMQTLLETDVQADSLGLSVHTVATIGGALPGVVSVAGYARRPDRPPRVVVLLLEDLPMGVFYHLLQTGLDKGFQLRLFSDDDFLRQVRQRLAPGTTAAAPRKSQANFRTESTGRAVESAPATLKTR